MPLIKAAAQHLARHTADLPRGQAARPSLSPSATAPSATDSRVKGSSPSASSPHHRIHSTRIHGIYLKARNL